MTQKELEQKVIDAEGRVAKREAVLKKHNSQLAKMVEKGADRFDISIKREDIKSATSKLAEAREILKNWQDKLNTRITRDAYRRSSASAPASSPRSPACSEVEAAARLSLAMRPAASQEGRPSPARIHATRPRRSSVLTLHTVRKTCPTGQRRAGCSGHLTAKATTSCSAAAPALLWSTT